MIFYLHQIPLNGKFISYLVFDIYLYFFCTVQVHTTIQHTLIHTFILLINIFSTSDDDDNDQQHSIINFVYFIYNLFKVIFICTKIYFILSSVNFCKMSCVANTNPHTCFVLCNFITQHQIIEMHLFWYVCNVPMVTCKIVNRQRNGRWLFMSPDSVCVLYFVALSDIGHHIMMMMALGFVDFVNEWILFVRWWWRRRWWGLNIMKERIIFNQMNF